MFVSVADETQNAVVESDSSNQEGDDLPPVLPHQLVKIDLWGFNGILSDQMAWLEKMFTAIHHIG
jgi:hypothetical protein